MRRSKSPAVMFRIEDPEYTCFIIDSHLRKANHSSQIPLQAIVRVSTILLYGCFDVGAILFPGYGIKTYIFRRIFTSFKTMTL
jgi:hypothetical protein